MDGTSEIEKCSPTDPATFLFAYSNDLDYSDVAMLYSEYGSGVSYKIKYTVAATVRFDTKTKEDIVIHEGETVVDSYNAAYSYLNKTQVDPSQRFDSSETESDVLDMLERFINTNRSNICESVALILMKRSPNGIEISKIVEKIREYHFSIINYSCKELNL
ncbi:Protein CBG15862 [Caenorhabditis briggsae]|uniref:Protein CBG15862 n=1 Tax=Caenorhabditis briggsae TaxID=6238 RepID=A8XMV4_CAEBR|nr:Protein CBG15862 [Caenorhabditis briggsae]CAP33979.2 Protein CBG15862 [Caenorhabditis briggsae]